MDFGSTNLKKHPQHLALMSSPVDVTQIGSFEHQKIFRKLDSPELGRKTEIILLYQSFGIIIGGLWMQDTVQF